MRALVIMAALATLTSAVDAAPKASPKPAAPAEQTWIGTCFGEDTQYTQTVGGAGFFHVGNGDRTYDTQKLVQSFYDGTTICAIPDPKAPRASSNVAEVCANRTTRVISVLYQRDTLTKMVIPKNAGPYCRARIDVL
jgi:hypothetical protein